VRVWDVEKGEAIGFALEGHCSRVSSIAFSLNGMQVASGSSDGTVRVWDVHLGSLVAVHNGYHAISFVVFYLSSNFLPYILWCDSNFGFGQHDRSSVLDAMTDLLTKTLVSFSQPTIDDTGFLVTVDGHQLIWIPAHLRGDKIAVHLKSHTVVVGGAKGAITIIRVIV
jgi:WD40 repeat protein